MNNPIPVIAPTEAEAYEALPYHFPLLEQQPVVRIPVAGPTPFNTLAVVRTIVHVMRRAWASGEVDRFRVTMPTGLTLAHYDPQRPEQQHVIHSSSATIHMMQISPERDFITDDDNTDFLIAVDAISADSLIDQDGRWNLVVDLASSAWQVFAGATVEISSWVLCFEPVGTQDGYPTPGGSAAISTPKQLVDNLINFAEARDNLNARLIDNHQIEQAAALVPETIAAYRQYARLPGADVLRAGRDLTGLANRMAGTRPAEALATQQALVDLYRDYTPQETDRLIYEINFAEARDNLNARLIDNHQIEQAAALVPETIAAYRQYARLPGADVLRAGRDLTGLANRMAGTRPAEALATQQALVDLYRDYTPQETDRLIYEINFAEARDNLNARLIDNHQIEQAAALVPETIAAYRQYARLPGADVLRAGRDLTGLANRMAGTRPAEALATQQALVDLYRDYTPQETDRLIYEINFAEARDNLNARLIDNHQIEQAAALVPETIAAYRQYARLPGADVLRAGRDLTGLANRMAGTRPAEALATQQALVDLYRDYTPQETDRLIYEINFAEARDNLNARLIDNHQIEQAAALVPETIAAYRQYARLPGADVLRAGRDLTGLANRMAGTNRPTEAADAQQAADELRNANR